MIRKANPKGKFCRRNYGAKGGAKSIARQPLWRWKVEVGGALIYRVCQFPQCNKHSHHRQLETIHVMSLNLELGRNAQNRSPGASPSWHLHHTDGAIPQNERLRWHIGKWRAGVGVALMLTWIWAHWGWQGRGKCEHKKRKRNILLWPHLTLNDLS